MKKVLSFLLVTCLMCVSLPFGVTATELSTPTHKTGKFSDISSVDFVKNIKTGVNFLGSDYNFNIDWIDVDEHVANPSIALPIRVGGQLGDTWTVSEHITMYEGDTKLLTFPVEFQEASESIAPGEGNIGFQIDFPAKYGSLVNQKCVLKVSDAKLITKEGTEYPLEGLNGTQDIILENNPWGISYAFGTNRSGDTLLTLDMTEGANISAVFEVINAPDEPEENINGIYYPSAAFVSDTVFDLKYFDALKETGFNAVRLNIYWHPFINNETFEIDNEYLNAVEKVVSYATDLDMYVIITMQNDYVPWAADYTWVGTHHEPNWMLDEYKDYVDARFGAVWKQIAEYFKDYDELVIFQAQNEPNMEYDETLFPKWEDYASLMLKRVNEMNQVYIDSVRGTGGNNAKRFLMFEGPTGFPGKPPWWGIEDVAVLTDSANDALLFSMHNYPASDPFLGIDLTSWSKDKPSDTQYADDTLQFCADFTVQTGIPVIMDETGSLSNLENESRVEVIKYFYAKAKKLGIPCLWWEESRPDSPEGDDFGLMYNLKTKTWKHQDMVDAIMKVIYG